MTDANFRKTDDYFERTFDPDLNAIAPRCFDRGHQHFCPSVATYVSSMDGMILISLEAGRAGLFNSFTPEGVRQFAADIVRVAEKVEAQQAATANAQLAAALAKKGQ